MKIKSKKNFLILCLLMLICSFTFNFVDPLDYEKKNVIQTKIFQTSDDYQITSSNGEPAFGNLTDVPENVDEQYDYFRNVILDIFNMTLSDYYSLTGNNSIMFNNYVYALWGYNNGTLSEEEARELTKHSTPKVYCPSTGEFLAGYNPLYLYPTPDDLIRNDDEEFRLRFVVEPLWGERVTRVAGYLDRDESPFLFLPWFNTNTAHRLTILGGWDFGTLEGNDWVGICEWYWGFNELNLEAVLDPNFVDPWVEVWIWVSWEFYDMFAGVWLPQTAGIYICNSVMIDLVWPNPPIFIPLGIYDDDTTKPTIECYIVDDADLLWKAWDTIFFGFQNDPELSHKPIRIQNNVEYGYSDGKYLFFGVRDNSPGGTVIIDLQRYLGPIALPPEHYEFESGHMQIWNIFTFFGTKIPFADELYGNFINLTHLAKGIKYEFTVKVKDSDRDRPGDSLLSDELKFTLYSDAPPPTQDDDIALSLSGRGQLLEDADAVLPDNDFSYRNWATGDDYDVLPYKKNTKPSMVKFNLTLHNPFEFPLRFKLNYTQFENDGRLFTFLDINKFKIVEHNENGRENYYEGFADTSPSVIERTFFNTTLEILPLNYDIGIGSQALWVELLPGETKIFEDFLGIRKNFFFEMLDNIYKFEHEVALFKDITNELSSIAFDMINLDINTESLGDEYLIDGVSNLFNLITQYNFLDTLKAVSHFGLRVEKVYYPRYYISDSDDVGWHSENVIEDRNALNLMCQLHYDSDTVGYKYDKNSGFNTFKLMFFPSDEQIQAFNTFVHQIILRDSLLYVSALSSSYFLPGDPRIEQMEKYTLTTALGINSIMYYFKEIMNGITSHDFFDEKVTPELIELPLDLFPELLYEDELAKRSLSFLKTSYKIEANLYGYYTSMKRYNAAYQQEAWTVANNQLTYAYEFSKNAEKMMLNLSTDLSFILAEISANFGDLESNLFSDVNISSLKDNFIYDSRYSECLTRQASFRNDDTNDNSWKMTSSKILEYKGKKIIREISLDALNSIPFYSTSILVFRNIEKSSVHDSVEIQTEKLNLPVVENSLLVSEISSKIQQAESLFDEQDYQEIIDLMSQAAITALDEYLVSRDPEFSILYFKASRLRDMAQKYNQIEFNMLDCTEKTVINGQNIDFIFQIHNDYNDGIYPSTRILSAVTEIPDLPPDVNFKITDLNDVELPKDSFGKYHIQLEKEEFKLLKLKIEIPLNSPYELEEINFNLKFSQTIPGKVMTHRQSFSVEILEDDITPPEISLYLTDGGYDGTPGIINVEIIEDDHGSTSTASLIITGPDNFEHTILYNEGSFQLNLIDIPINELGTYTATLIAENNDEDRGDIDEESIETSIEFTIFDDDTSEPEISISHSGGTTDENPGLLIIDIIEFDSGSEATGTLAITGPYNYEHYELFGEGHFELDLTQIFLMEPGTYNVILQAENNDEDRGLKDEEFAEVSMSFAIIDDDGEPPEIIECLYPALVFDNEEYIEINMKAEDFSGIDNVIEFNGTGYLSQLTDGYYVIQVPTPQALGVYTGTIEIWDADNDRLNDQESSTYQIEFEVDDDDKEPPIIIFEEIGYSWDSDLIKLTFDVSATDDSGISFTEIKIASFILYGGGIHEISLPSGIYNMNITMSDNDNDRPNDDLSTFETYELIFDLTPPETNLMMLNYYIDDLGTIYVTSGTQFNFSALDDVSGVVYTKYRINNSEWNFQSDVFYLPNEVGFYIIDYFSVDNNDNIEDIKTEEVILVKLDVDTYITRGEAEVLPYFDVIFTKYKDGGYKLVATNPGQFFYTIEITNSWPTAIDEITVNLNLPLDFILKGSNPILILLDGFDITSSCVIQEGILSISNIPAGGIIRIKAHIDYALKGEIFSTLEEFGLKEYTFKPILQANSQFLEGNYESSTKLVAHQKKVTSIAGHVYDADGNPIVGLEIKLYDIAGNLIATSITDENGFFYFIGIDAGEHSVEFSYQSELFTELVIAVEMELAYLIFNL